MRVDLRASIAVYLATGVKLPARVVKFSPPLALDATGAPLPEAGRDLALLRVEDGVYAAIGISAREGQIGDAVHILGFPALLLTHELLDRGASAEASVTNGAISGFKKDAIGLDVIQTDASATYGTSGAPAIGNDAMLVGVMTFVSLSPTTGTPVQGFNFLVPARDVRRFLGGRTSTSAQSRFNAPWADALEAFFRGDHRVAASKLALLDALAPGLPDVKRVLEVARERTRLSPRRPRAFRVAGSPSASCSRARGSTACSPRNRGGPAAARPRPPGPARGRERGGHAGAAHRRRSTAVAGRPVTRATVEA